MPSISPNFQQTQLLGPIQHANGFIIQRPEPGKVTLRLRGNHDKVLFRMRKESRRPLLTLFIIPFRRLEWLKAVEIHAAPAHRLPVARLVAQKQISPDILHVLSEELAHHRASRIVTGHKQIETRLLKMHSPRRRFVSGTGGAMQGEGRQRLLEKPVVIRRMLHPKRSLVQIIVDIQRPKVRSDEQGIALAHKITTHLQHGSTVVGGHHGNGILAHVKSIKS